MSELGGSDGEDAPDQEQPSSGWVSYLADKHGLPKKDGNEHLTPEQRTGLEQAARDRAERRGRHQATVVVDVYESGEAVAQVQFPKESSLDMHDRPQVNEAVRKAAEALLKWS